MKRAIHGKDEPHLSTALTLWAIEFVYHNQKKLSLAADFLEQSIEMLRILHGRNSVHPHIRLVQCDLANVYECQGGREEVLGIFERNAVTGVTRDGESLKHTNGN